MDQPRKTVVAIIGLGLLGASLGMALRGKAYRRIGWTRRESVRRWALESDVLDECGDNLEETLGKADLTLFALPLPEIERYLANNASCFRPGSVVSDLGSCKSGIMHAASRLKCRGVHFIGGHPMAGAEKFGPESAFPELYRNADVFVCPYEDSPEEAIRLLEAFWQSLGAHTSRISAERHDDLVARTSHMPHVLASALVLSVLESPDEKTRIERFRGCATGFRDMSRIASSSPAMWREIIESNREYVLGAMRDFERCCETLRRMIESGDFDGFERKFAQGKRLRDRWLESKMVPKQEKSSSLQA